MSVEKNFKEINLSAKYLSVIEKAPHTERQYLGQPDMVMLDDEQTLLTVYPVGHGFGPLVMQVSEDAGESWQEKEDLPETWASSLETPTLYKLNLANETTRLILITGMPKWEQNTEGGWRTSISDDLGKTWSEYKHFHRHLPNGADNWSIVAMASLIQLHDKQGTPIDKWMGVYHDANFVNYKSYLSFDEKGQEIWTKPSPYLDEYRAIESSHKICEVGLFRSPDQQKIIGLGRSQSHEHHSVFFYSIDEGKTWTEPAYLHEHLTGERHKAVYDPISGRLVVTFREIAYQYDADGQMLTDQWQAGNWLAWVGSYEALVNGEPGDYRIILAKDWTNSPKGGDTGYAGIVAHPDGHFIMNSYGHWDRAFSEAWTGPVTEDLAYIIQAKFKLSTIEEQLGKEGNQVWKH